jgi:hypothetical protein
LELGLKRQELKALRYPLERCGAIVSRSVVMPAGAGDGHVHSSELMRWDQAHPQRPDADVDPGPHRAFASLVVAGVRAAVLAPEAELRRWFSWQWYWTNSLVDDLVARRLLYRVNGHVAVTAEQEG